MSPAPELNPEQEIVEEEEAPEEREVPEEVIEADAVSAEQIATIMGESSINEAMGYEAPAAPETDVEADLFQWLVNEAGVTPEAATMAARAGVREHRGDSATVVERQRRSALSYVTRVDRSTDARAPQAFSNESAFRRQKNRASEGSLVAPEEAKSINARAIGNREVQEDDRTREERYAGIEFEDEQGEELRAAARESASLVEQTAEQVLGRDVVTDEIPLIADLIRESGVVGYGTDEEMVLQLAAVASPESGEPDDDVMELLQTIDYETVSTSSSLWKWDGKELSRPDGELWMQMALDPEMVGYEKGQKPSDMTTFSWDLVEGDEGAFDDEWQVGGWLEDREDLKPIIQAVVEQTGLPGEVVAGLLSDTYYDEGGLPEITEAEEKWIERQTSATYSVGLGLSDKTAPSPAAEALMKKHGNWRRQFQSPRSLGRTDVSRTMSGRKTYKYTPTPAIADNNAVRAYLRAGRDESRLPAHLRGNASALAKVEQRATAKGSRSNDASSSRYSAQAIHGRGGMIHKTTQRATTTRQSYFGSLWERSKRVAANESKWGLHGAFLEEVKPGRGLGQAWFSGNSSYEQRMEMENVHRRTRTDVNMFWNAERKRRGRAAQAQYRAYEKAWNNYYASQAGGRGGGRGGGGGGGGTVVKAVAVLPTEAEVRESVNTLYRQWFRRDATDGEVRGLKAKLDGVIRHEANQAAHAQAYGGEYEKTDKDALILDHVRKSAEYQQMFQHKQGGQTEEEYANMFEQTSAQVFGAEMGQLDEGVQAGMRSGDSQTAIGYLAGTKEAQDSSTYQQRVANAADVIARLT